jgi:hypothetical protein
MTGGYFVFHMHIKALTRMDGWEGIIEIIPIWIYSSEVPGMYHDFETHGRTTPLQHLPTVHYADVDDATPREMVEWHSPAASTGFSTMSFPPDAMNRINETEGRCVLKDAVRYPGSEAMALMT